MFSSLLIPPCELRLHLLNSIIYLYPPSRRSDAGLEAPPNQNDSMVRGLVELYAPSPRHITGIKVKLRGLQTVAILDPTTGVVPLNWEDEVLMEQEVVIGMPPRQVKKERGRTPGPSRTRTPGASAHTSPAQSRQASPARGRDHSRTPEDSDVGRGRSRGSTRDSTARHSPDGDAEDSGPESRSTLTTNLSNAFARAVSRGRTGRESSQPSSRQGSRSRPSSPNSRRALSSFASTSNSAALRSASAAPTIVPPSPTASSPPYEEEDFSFNLTGNSQRGPDRPVPGIDEALRLGSLSIGSRVERSRAANHVGGLGHPDHDQFGLRETIDLEPPGSRPSQAGLGATPLSHSSRHRGRGGFASVQESASPRISRQGNETQTGSVPPPSNRARGKSKTNEARSSSLGWARWSRSVSRARHGGEGREEARTTSSHVGTSVEDEDGNSATADGIFLEKGVHGFEFAFMLPATSAEYVRSPFGRVRYVVKATVYGGGRAKSNVEAWRDCYPIANPTSESGPIPLTVLYNDLHPTVGLLYLACTSQNASVGGLFNIDISSPVPPPDLQVYLVRVVIETAVEIRSKGKGRQNPPKYRTKVFERGYVPPRKGDPHREGDGNKSEGLVHDPTRDGLEKPWEVHAVARMPDDNTIRSSTMHGTKSAIRFSHQLLVEIIHSREPDEPGGERKKKVFNLRQPITLPSCCVALDASSLPMYTATADDGSRPIVDGLPYDLAMLPDGTPNPRTNLGTNPSSGSAASAANTARQSTFRNRDGSQHDTCVCGLSLTDLEARQRSLFPAALSNDVPLDVLRPHGKIGEILPPRPRTSHSGSRSRSASVRSRRGSNASSQRSHGATLALARSISRSRGGRASSSSRRSPSANESQGRDSLSARQARDSSVTRMEYSGGSSAQRTASRQSRFSVSTTSSAISNASGPATGSDSVSLQRPPTRHAQSTRLEPTLSEGTHEDANRETGTGGDSDMPPSYESATIEDHRNI